MNSDQLQGKWKQMMGSAKQHFGKLTGDDLEVIAGHRDKLVGKLQERYGYIREEAMQRADAWLNSQEGDSSGAASSEAAADKTAAKAKKASKEDAAHPAHK